MAAENEAERETFEEKMALRVGRYGTPLAVALVSMGIVLTQPAGRTSEITIGLLVAGIVFNMVMARLIRAPGAGCWHIRVRLVVNVGINASIVYFLGSHWPPVWLLLALTPLATAVYSSRGKALFAAGVIGLLLAAIQVARGSVSPLAWGQVVAEIAFIVALSLLVNDVTRLARLADRHGETLP